MAIRQQKVIDALEIRLPGQSRFAEEVQVILDQPTLRIRRTKYYRRILDLRPFGFSSLLHYANWKTGDHKLELTNVGIMALSTMLAEIAAVIECDPCALEIMRVDLAADVFGYTVDWFHENMWASRKRYSKEIFENGCVRTFYLGRRPDFFRIYDKGGLRRIAYQHLLSHQSTCKPLPSFKEMHSHSINEVLTRVERQCGGGRVPKQIDTLGKLASNAVIFNPFETLKIRAETRASEAIADEYRGGDYFNAQALLRLIEKRGLAEARRTIHEKTSGNASRFLKRLDRLVMGASQAENLDLYAEYQRSVTQQLAGAGKWAN